MQFEETLDALYETVFEPGAWRRAASKCAALVDGTTFFLQVARPAEGVVDVVSGHGLEGLGIPAYEAHYHKIDIWRQGLLASARNRVHLYPEIVEQSRYEGSEVFADWVKPGAGYDIFWGLGACLRMGAGEVGFLAAHRSRRRGEMTERDRALFQRLVPHVRRVLRMRRVVGDLTSHMRGLEALCDRATCAMTLVDRCARLVYANRQASDLLCKEDGLRMRADGTIEAKTPAETAALHAALFTASTLRAPAHGASTATLAVTRADGAQPLIASVCPVPGEMQPVGRSYAILVIEEPVATAMPAAEKIRLAFGLTASEARLAQRIGSGETLRDAAAAENVTYETARTRLKAIFHKTRTTRQAQLALLLANIAEARP